MKKRILIVDDEQKINWVFSRLLSSAECEVVGVTDPVQANDKLKKEKFDLVLLDIKMPEVDGVTLYEIIRLFHNYTKVIVASVYPVEEQKKHIPDAQGYFDKSQGIHSLLKLVRNTIGHDEEAGEAHTDHRG